MRPSPFVSKNDGSRIAGLDSVRLGAALIVALSHGMLIPPRIYSDAGSALAFWSGAVGHMLANGPAAVAVFFVISGLCIHLGRESVASNPLQFLLRRMVRIGLPIMAISALMLTIGQEAFELEQGVLWSVYCELFYYLIYPLLLIARRRWPLSFILIFSSAVSAMLVAVLPPQARMWEYGIATAFICYPLWLLGALLAERAGGIPAQRSDLIWVWRAGMILVGAWCAAMRSVPWAADLPVVTYAVVGILAVPYLRAEIANAKAGFVSRSAECFGKASYSLYLAHIVPLIFIDRATTALPQWLAGTIELATVISATIAFYYLCEKPAQRLAQSIFVKRSWRRNLRVSRAA